SVDAEHDVVRLEAGFIRRTILANVADDDAVVHAERPQRFGLRIALPGNTDGTAGDFALANDVVIGAHHRVHGQREADALIAAAWRGNHGVHADHFALNIQEGSAAVAGVDGGIGLNEALKLLADFLAVRRAHDAGGDRRF